MAKILVIDDEENILQLLRDILSKKGHCVCTATSGEEGIAVAEQELPDLILLDVSMPGMDGEVTRRRLLDNTKTKHIRSVFLTSIVTQEEECMLQGLSEKNPYISKFSNTFSILKKIESLLETKEKNKI